MFKWLLLSIALNIVLIFIILQQHNTNQPHRQVVVPEKPHQIVNQLPVVPPANQPLAQLPVNEQYATNTRTPVTRQNAQWQTLEALAQAGDWPAIQVPLQEYLRRFPNDLTALFLEAQWVFFTQSPIEGISAMYRLLTASDDNQLNQQIQTFIQTYTQSRISRLIRDQDWQALALFSEPLFTLQPESRAYIRALAMAYAYLDLPSAMENTLASLPYDDTLAQYIRQLWQARYHPPNENASVKERTDNPPFDIIALQSQAQQFLVPIQFADRAVLLLLDTGASTTALTTQALAQIPDTQRTYLRDIYVKTANGIVRTALYRVKETRFGQQQLNDIEVIELPENEGNTVGFDGLLGMNILSKYDFILDQDAGLLELKRLR